MKYITQEQRILISTVIAVGRTEKQFKSQLKIFSRYLFADFSHEKLVEM